MPGRSIGSGFALVMCGAAKADEVSNKTRKRSKK
jgi:hypothetical protein